MLRKVTNLGRKKTNTVEVGVPDSEPQTPTRLKSVDTRSSFSLAVTAADRTTTADRKRDVSPAASARQPVGSGPLGLNVVYTPDHGRKADIVFVHGLGGTSRWSWSKNKDPELFWPLTFLPLEPDLCLARILTFGYNASFQKPGNIGTSVLDFAKDLLFDMKYGKDPNMGELDMGTVPILFVVHSMGGLVVKEAYMQGQHDPEYEAIIKAVTAITFLSTPHRGTALAQTLNRILDTVMVNSKQYVSELGKNSSSLQKLNEQFRHIAPRLQIVSFYETMPTKIGVKGAAVMVLEKDSSVLGYPGEVSKALNADHHGVCKFEGPHDPNYVTVRNVLKTIVSKIIATDNAKSPILSDRRTLLDLKGLLALPEPPGLDYIFFRDQWTNKTHEWIKRDSKFQEWHNSDEGGRILWINGGAGTGKSILASTIVHELTQQGRLCQFCFIRYGHHQKRTLSFLLRSLAYQIGQSVPSLIPKIAELGAEGLDYETADARVVSRWDWLFRSVIFKADFSEPLHWVIDGVDESESPRALIKMLLDLAASSPVRILLTSRRHTEIDEALDRRPPSVGLSVIEIEDGQPSDIRVHVQQQLRVPGGDEVRARVEEQILKHAQSNFLWVHLAVEKVNRCRTIPDIDAALLELPEGMDALYDRMAHSVENIRDQRDKQLAKQILQCITCSARALAIAELSQALGEAARGILDLAGTVRELCGDFVVIDNDGKVDIVHHTAREYLLSSSETRPFAIDRVEAHKALLTSSLQCLMSTGLRAKLARNQTPEFMEYAASYWSTHLSHTSLGDETVVRQLTRFLTGKWLLTWIQFVAASGQLKALTQASQHLLKCVHTRRGSLCAVSTFDRDLISSWSTDLGRIVGRFGNLLRRSPESIYGTIPAFCPKGSSMYQQFGVSDSLEIQGLTSDRWDDLFARVSLGKAFASMVLAAGSQVAVLTAPGSIRFFEASDFREAQSSPIQHGERVDFITMNKSASLLASYGYRTTKVWNLSTGRCMLSFDSIESRTRPLAVLFTNDDSTLLVGTDDRRLRSVRLSDPDPTWTVVSAFEEEELDGHVSNSATHMALSNDGTMAVLGYRGYPASAWDVDPGGEQPAHIGHCRREDPGAVVRELRQLVWHPFQSEVFGLNFEGTVFRWAPYEDDVAELPGNATTMAISNDGSLLVTGDSQGRVALHSTSNLARLFHLSAQDAVFGLAFSPDSKRFYDLRAYHLNAWEPTVLARISEPASDDQGSSSSFDFSQASDISTITSAVVDPITCVAGCPSGRFYCCGTQKGNLSLHSTSRGKLSSLYDSTSKFALDHVAWSSDSKYICAMDFSKHLVVFEVSDLSGDEPVCKQLVSTSLRKFVKGQAVHLSFKEPQNTLFIQTTSHLHVVSISSGLVERSAEFTTPVHSWIAHPNNPRLLVGFAADEIVTVDVGLVEQARWKMAWPPGTLQDLGDSCHPERNRAERAFLTSDGRHFVLQVSSHSDRSRKMQICFLETTQLPSEIPDEKSANIPSLSICVESLDTAACGDIVRVLGLLKGDRLLYISSDHAVCSLWLRWVPEQRSSRREHGSSISRHESAQSHRVDGAKASSHKSSARASSGVSDKRIKELFALPDDWASDDAVKSSSVWHGQSSLLYPRNGQVAVVRCKGLA